VGPAQFDLREERVEPATVEVFSNYRDVALPPTPRIDKWLRDTGKSNRDTDGSNGADKK
jgi:hypothetical protein